MNLPSIIQGGMGVAISDWRLARSVAVQGHLGVVSGTGLVPVMIARLMDGDQGEHVRRALGKFPFQEPVQRILATYYRPEEAEKITYKRTPLWTLEPPKALEELTVISNFVEVFLAKEAHGNPVGLNLLEKIQLPTMASLYGAMLAGVDVVIMGAGIPLQVPGILDKLSGHAAVHYRVDVDGALPDDEYQLEFDPKALFDVSGLEPLSRPYFLPVISSLVLAKALMKRATGKVDGFIVEMPSAGGHNAPPRGAMQLDEAGEPIYGAKDAVNLEKLRALGLPFWLAGGYDSPERLQAARAAGATGVQVGTAFGYCDESGMDAALKARVLAQVTHQALRVHTSPLVSPTGYPFKVVELAGTMTDPVLYQQRVRRCDIGLLRKPCKDADGRLAYRCPSEPVAQYVAKGGDVTETEGRQCLCNNLCATAGFPQRRKDGYLEVPIVTAGDELVNVAKYIRPGQQSYTAKDVLDYLTA